MTTSKKIPSRIAKELARHIKSPSKTISKSSSSSEGNGSKLATVMGCFAFVGVTASLPFWAMKWIGPLNEKDAALTGSQIRRGAFNNSGSRDVGKDPNWDFKTGTRKKDKDYVDLFVKDNPDEVDHGDKFLANSKR